jgi:hypothetical protein
VDKVEKIKDILMRRDRMTGCEADDLIEDAKNALAEYLSNGDDEAAENICEEFFGLEPDYLDELI